MASRKVLLYYLVSVYASVMTTSVEDKFQFMKIMVEFYYGFLPLRLVLVVDFNARDGTEHIAWIACVGEARSLLVCQNRHFIFSLPQVNAHRADSHGTEMFWNTTWSRLTYLSRCERSLLLRGYTCSSETDELLPNLDAKRQFRRTWLRLRLWMGTVLNYWSLSTDTSRKTSNINKYIFHKIYLFIITWLLCNFDVSVLVINTFSENEDK